MYAFLCQRWRPNFDTSENGTKVNCPQKYIPSNIFPTRCQLHSPFASWCWDRLAGCPEKCYHQGCITMQNTPRHRKMQFHIWTLTTLAFLSIMFWGFTGEKGGERKEIAGNYSVCSCKYKKYRLFSSAILSLSWHLRQKNQAIEKGRNRKPTLLFLVVWWFFNTGSPLQTDEFCSECVRKPNLLLSPTKLV